MIEQHKKLTALEVELAVARQEGFVTDHLSKTKTPPKKWPLVMIGVFNGFGHKNNREVIRKASMATSEALKKIEDEKGVTARFVIGRRKDMWRLLKNFQRRLNCSLPMLQNDGKLNTMPS